MGILHCLGLITNYIGILKGYSIDQAVQILKDSGNEYKKIADMLISYQKESYEYKFVKNRNEISSVNVNSGIYSVDYERLSEEKMYLLKNLNQLIRTSTQLYQNEFIWQDINLTDEFKEFYKKYLEKTGCNIEFFDHTAVVTTSSFLYIYVPNQWFVIASYAVGVYEELMKYKNYAKKTAKKMGRKFNKEIAEQLRNNMNIEDKIRFINFAKEVFEEETDDPNIIAQSSERLWRFVSDYSWWSGQKTIDRGDFYISTILNMLNLVNVSQGYVADIVCAYASDPDLNRIVTDIYSFTLGMEIDISNDNTGGIIQNESGMEVSILRDEPAEYGESNPIVKPEKVKIKIKSTGGYKEIKFKK